MRYTFRVIIIFVVVLFLSGCTKSTTYFSGKVGNHSVLERCMNKESNNFIYTSSIHTKTETWTFSEEYSSGKKLGATLLYTNEGNNNRKEVHFNVTDKNYQDYYLYQHVNLKNFKTMYAKNWSDYSIEFSKNNDVFRKLDYMKKLNTFLDSLHFPLLELEENNTEHVLVMFVQMNNAASSGVDGDHNRMTMYYSSTEFPNKDIGLNTFDGSDKVKIEFSDRCQYSLT